MLGFEVGFTVGLKDVWGFSLDHREDCGRTFEISSSCLRVVKENYPGTVSLEGLGIWVRGSGVVRTPNYHGT